MHLARMLFRHWTFTTHIRNNAGIYTQLCGAAGHCGVYTEPTEAK